MNIDLYIVNDEFGNTKELWWTDSTPDILNISNSVFGNIAKEEDSDGKISEVEEITYSTQRVSDTEYTIVQSNNSSVEIEYK